jgi:hypothetical protein
MRECLQKNGVTLPKPTIGRQRPPGAGTELPKGVTRAQYEAALKKCGGGLQASGNRKSSSAFKAALSKFAVCLREHGIKLPAPNTSGTGPVFDTKGVNTKSAQFRVAETKCAGVLRAGFAGASGARGKAGGSPATAGGGAPGSAGAAGAAGSASPIKASPKFRPKIKVPPKLTRELEKFTACMRTHGVTNYPEPEGAGFNIGNLHLDTKSAQYKAAEKKCEPILQAAFS